MAERARSLEEIIARVISREALLNPKMRGMWAVMLGGALVLSLLLLVDFFQVASPISLDFLAPAGPPYRVLLIVALALEGLLAVGRLARHEEPPYPALTQAAGITVGAVGAIFIGLGLLIFLLWVTLFSVYNPTLLWIPMLYYALLLIGSATLLAALPPLGASLIRPLVREPP